MKSLSLTQPHAIVMVGVPGSGKSYFAEKFSDTFNAPRVDYAAFTNRGLDATAAHELALQQVKELAKTKSSIVIDGGASSRIDRTTLTRTLKDLGYQTLFVWVQTDQDTAFNRFIKNGGTEEYFLTLAKRFSPPHSTEKPIVISGKHTYASQAKTVLKRLSAPRAEISSHTTPPVRFLNDVRRGR